MATTKRKNWKRELVEKKLAEGDKRTYNELMADLELEVWTERYYGKMGNYLKS